MSTTSKIIVLIGFQASTKSSAAKEIHENTPNSVILSRDTEGGTIERLVAKAEAKLNDGKVVILDNTNLTKQTRKQFIDLANRLKVPIEAQYFKTTIEDCQIRHLRRMYDKFGEIYQTGTNQNVKKDPHCFGSVVLFKARKDLEEPAKDEGFNSITVCQVPSPIWDSSFKNKALFLDIDGTIRKTDHLPNKYPVNPDEVELLHSVNLMNQVLSKYTSQGYKLIGLSNQSGIAKGTLTKESADATFEKTRALLGYTAEEFPILYCPHRPAPITCFCRKPQTGMAMECIMKYKLDPRDCIMVGDMKTDEEMARRLSMKYIDVKAFWKF